MYKSLTASLLLTISMHIHADPLLLDDLKSQNGVQLTVDELKVLMPGAKVVSQAGTTGSTRRWTNDLDGKFVASSDNRSGSGGHGGNTTAQGTWSITDNGTYCVTLEWRRLTENWCRYIFKVGDKYYGVSSIDSGTTKAHEFEFSK
jgi:Protein of unknown function (DUF995)